MITGFVLLVAALPAQPPAATLFDSSPLAEFVAQGTATAPPAGPVVPKWTGSIAVGATYQDGNTDSRAINMTAQAERRSEQDRWTGKAYWDYSEEKDQSTGDFVLGSRKAGASLKYDYFLTKKFYVNGVAGAETDSLADLQLRSYAGAGVGYQWREDAKIKEGSEVGITYFSEKRYVDKDKNYPAARLANNFEWHLNDKTSFANTLEAFPSLEYGEDFFGRSDTRLKTSLTEAMFAQIQWVFDYDNTPSAGKGRQDNKVVLGIGWSF